MRSLDLLLGAALALTAAPTLAQTPANPSTPTPGVSAQDQTPATTPPATTQSNDVRQTRRVPQAPPGSPPSPASPPSVAPATPAGTAASPVQPAGPSGTPDNGGSTSTAQPPAPGVRSSSPGVQQT